MPFTEIPPPQLKLDTTDVERLRSVDRQTAIDICSMAAMPTCDALGNLLPGVWDNSVDTARDRDALLDVNDLRKLMLKQIEKHIEKRQDLILEMDENETLVKWVTQFTSTWEVRYREEKNQHYDIGPIVFSIMQEAVFQVLSWLREYREDIHDGILARVKDEIFKCQVRHKDVTFVTKDHALVRVLFRIDEFNQPLCRFAAKLLQRRQGNRSGVVNTVKQMNSLDYQQRSAMQECMALLCDPERLLGLEELARQKDALQLNCTNLAMYSGMTRRARSFKICNTCNKMVRIDDDVCDQCQNGVAVR